MLQMQRGWLTHHHNFIYEGVVVQSINRNQSRIFGNLIPNTGNILFTTLMIALTLWAQSVGAISLGAMTENGSPLDGAYTMRFCLYNGVAGGSSLWCEQWSGANQVQLTDGLFNVLLGSQNAILQNTIADNSTLFLGVTIGVDSELSPRTQIGTLNFPDKIIPSTQVKLSHGEARARFDPWYIPLTVDYTEIPGTRFELTLDTPQTLFVNGHFDFMLENNSWAEGGLFVNGNRIPKLAILRDSDRHNVSQTWIVNLNAGTNTLYLGAKKRHDGEVAYIVQSHTNLTWFSFAR